MAGWFACASQPATRGNGEIKPNPSAPIEMRLVRAQMGKPPLVRFYFDVSLRNEEAEPRWFILPSAVPVRPVPNAGVDVLEPFAVGGAKHAVLGRFLGTAGFYAVLLPAHGILKLHGLEIGYWGSDADPHPNHLRIQGSTAAGLFVGGEPAERWFPQKPLCDAHVSEPAAIWTPLAVHRTSGHKEVPVTETQRVVMELDVPLLPLVSDASDARAWAGNRVGVEGTAQRAKLGDTIESSGFHVYCMGARFPDEVLGKHVQVEGVLELSKAFEATVGKAGEWSQGTEPGGEGIWILRDCVRR